MKHLVMLAQWLAFLVHHKFLSKEHLVEVFQLYARRNVEGLTLGQVVTDLQTSRHFQDVARFQQLGSQSLNQLLAEWDGKRANALKEVGEYVVLKELGRGGMGAVFLGYNVRSGRLDAIKVLSLHGADPTMMDRFRREAQAMAAVKHDNVAQIYSFGQIPGYLYMVMEYIQGDTFSKATDKMSHREIILLSAGMAAGIAAISKAGIIHRDIKPDNVMVTNQGRVVILDMGLAKFNSMESLTVSGELLGTAHMVPPEQAFGKTEVPLTPTVDTYSMGVTIYEALRRGIKLFSGSSALMVMSQIVQEEDLPGRAFQELVGDGVDERIARVVGKSLYKDPSQRPLPGQYQQDLQQVIDLLEQEEAQQAEKQRNELILVKKGLKHKQYVIDAQNVRAVEQQHEIDKQTSRGRKLLGVLSVLAVLALVLAGVALVAANQRKHADQLAQANEEKAEAAENLAQERAASLAAAESRAKVQRHSMLAALHETKYEWNKSIASISSALAVYPQESWGKHAEILGPLLRRRGQAYFHLRDDECIKDMVAAAKIEAEPFKSEALFWTVVFEATLNVQSGVRRERISQISNDRYRRLLQVFLATLPADASQRDAARTANLRRLEEVKQSDRDWVWHFIYGHTLSAPPTKENLEAALLAYDASLRLNPSFGMSYYNRAAVLTRLSTPVARDLAASGGRSALLRDKLLALQERALGDFRSLFLHMPDWIVAELNFAETICALAHFGTIKANGTDRASLLLEEALTLVRARWANTDQELGSYRFVTGFRMIQLLQVKRNRLRRLQRGSREIDGEAHRVWARLSRHEFSENERSLLARAKREFGFD